MRSFTSQMSLVCRQYSLFHLILYMVQQSGGFGSSATGSVNHLISLSFNFFLSFSPCIKNGNSVFRAFVKAFIALKGDL